MKNFNLQNPLFVRTGRALNRANKRLKFNSSTAFLILVEIKMKQNNSSNNHLNSDIETIFSLYLNRI